MLDIFFLRSKRMRVEALGIFKKKENMQCSPAENQGLFISFFPNVRAKKKNT